MIKPLQLGDGIMTDETKEFASIEDATPTTAIPSETDATTATTTMVTVDDRTDTTVLPSAADDDETAVLPVPDNHADASVSDVDTQATAASPSPIEPTTDRIALETVADAVEGDGGPIPSADDVPMYAASSARPPYGRRTNVRCAADSRRKYSSPVHLHQNRESEHPRNRLYPLFRHRHIPSFGLCDAASSGTCQTLRHPWHRGRERYPHR